ncbi:4'-phosphopantetheinyl transferase family protein [Actinomadura flavalba]|uniref:4'-phosphopantetheinyl transferase family protein n=1 Tax=Actinomadura flavalba TaxID=1120938 RepID=UPI0003676534|nr:4'-phosphopantetheinyl transferase superfamily protein [Actinomadura flavalba]
MEPVTVHWAALDTVRPHHVALLDAAERARRDRYVRPADRDRFTLGVTLTRLALARRLALPPERVPLTRACPDCDAPHGPPRIAGGPFLSVSHSGDRVAVAISGHGPVGVDVEEAAGRIGDDVAAHLLAPGESATGEDALLAYWTRKEALLKATGEGLREPMTHLRVSAPDAPPALLDWTGRPGLAARFTLRTLDPGPGHAACLALLDHPADVAVEERTFTPAARP